MKTRILTILFLLLTTLVCMAQPFEKQGAGVTLIVHGWDPNGDQPAWMTSMADAIIERNGGVGHIASITVTGTKGSLTATCSDWDFNLSAQTHAEAVVLINWTAVANHLTSDVTAQEVAAAVAPRIYEPQSGQPALAELPLHLIGHSRGGGMVFEIARLLGLQGVEVDQVTALDPHPLTTADPQGFTPTIDTPIAVYENILFADNYYQTIEAPTGQYVNEAYNRLWTGMPGGYHNESGYTHTIGTTTYNFSDHLNIILAYHGTIDMLIPTSNGEATMGATERGWFNTYENGGENTGFKYSRQIMCNRKSEDTPVPSGDAVEDGCHNDAMIGGNGERESISWTTANWPNVIEVLIADDGDLLEPGSSSLENGQELQVVVVYRGNVNAGDIILYVDSDRNPYNNNNVATIVTRAVSATGPSISALAETWEVSGVTEEEKFYVYAEYNDGSKKNFLYSPHEFEIPVTISPPSGEGTVVTPYQIETLQHLLWITQDVSRWDKHYIQTAHINASETSSWNDGEGWIPIGTDENPFTGSYNGQDYAINELYINSQTSIFNGLFGFTTGATLQNIGLTNAEIISNHFSVIGCLAGALDEGTSISNCYATGTITSTYSGSMIGGLVGGIGSDDTVENSHFNGSISGVDGQIGGFIGYSKGLITDSYFSGTVSSSGDSEEAKTGGLVGMNEEGTISSSYSTGNVSGFYNVGGLVGQNEKGTLSRSYSLGEVSGAVSYTHLTLPTKRIV